MSSPVAAADWRKSSPDPQDSFDDFNEDDVTSFEPIGTCIALYAFEGMMLRAILLVVVSYSP